jgi:hypothetical protein
MSVMSTNIIRFDEKRELFEKGLRKVYDDETKVLQNQYKEWLAETTANAWFEHEMGHSGLGVMPEKTVGGAITTDRIYYGNKRSYTMKAYALGLVIQYEVLRWDLYSVFKPITKELAKSAVTRYDLVAYGLWNNAFVTTSPAYTDYRGEAFLSATHTRMDGGSWKNRPTTDIGLSMTALQQGTEDLRLTVNERGLYSADMSPTHLLTSVANDWLAHTLLQSGYNPDNANQQINNAARYRMSIQTSPYHTTSTHWFLCCKPKSMKVRMAKGDDPDLVKDTENSTRNMVYHSYCSFRMEVYDGRGAYGSTGV